MRSFTLLPLLAFAACAGVDLDKVDSDIENELSEFAKAVPAIKKRVRVDDARIGIIQQKKKLSPAQARDVESFIRERHAIVARMEKVLEELEAIHKLIHTESGTEPDEAALEAVRLRLDAFHERRQYIKNDLDRIKRRDHVVTQMLMAAPNKN